MPIAKTVTATDGRYQNWSSVFQNRNNPWISDPRTIVGNFFLGLQGEGHQIFDAQIPAGSQIHSAIMRVTAHATQGSSTVTTQILAPNRSVPALEYRFEPLQKPFENFIGWREWFWADCDFDVRDTSATLQDQTSAGLNTTTMNLKQLGAPVPRTFGITEELGQGFIPSSNYTIGSITVPLRRVGSPTGNLRMRIEGSVQRTAQSITEPNGIVLATSDDVLASSLPLNPAPFSDIAFAFSGADQIALDSSTEYYLILEADYTQNGVNFVQARVRSAFFNIGQLRSFGEGNGLDYQNYPGTVDVTQAMVNASSHPSIPWSMPVFVAGTTYDTPDISALVQAQVDELRYTKDSGIIVTVDSISDPNQARQWRSPNNVFPTPAQLIVSYTPPGGGAGYGHGAVIPEPPEVKKVDKQRLARLALMAVTVIDSDN